MAPGPAHGERPGGDLGEVHGDIMTRSPEFPERPRMTEERRGFAGA
jgi:hypothetical protein